MTREVLRLVKERRLAELIPLPKSSGVLEASGIVAKGGDYYVIFDNVRQVARIDPGLSPVSKRHAWLGRCRDGDGYEDIAYSPARRRFYLLIEAEKHPDGSYKPFIDECDEAGRFKGQHPVDLAFTKRNTGLEGLSVVRWKGTEYLLALCEGNRCRAGKAGRAGGGGRIHVLQRKGAMWVSVATIKLPRTIDFEDYSAVALRGNRIAVVSQRDSRLWLGVLRRGTWTIAGPGRIYDFPRTKKGRPKYCTLEGICWLSNRRFVLVSDLTKSTYRKGCRKRDQSIHIFALPGR
jgi:phytase-like protein